MKIADTAKWPDRVTGLENQSVQPEALLAEGVSEPFDLIEYFSGETSAVGLFEDRFGVIRRSFTVAVVGRFDGKALTLEEHFEYADGAREERTWTIYPYDAGRYEGFADDIDGAAQGVSIGSSLHWQYTMCLKLKTRQLQVNFTDLMLLMPGGRLLSRARISKFGLTVGTVTLCFQK